MQRLCLLSCTALLAFASSTHAQTVVSANDAHSILQNGVQVLPHPLKPDSLSFLVQTPDGVWRVRTSINVPTSVIGPPTAVTFSPDGKTLVVSAASKPDPEAGKIVPDDEITVIDISGQNRKSYSA